MKTKYFEKAEKKYFSTQETILKKDEFRNEDIKNFKIQTDKYGSSKMKAIITVYEIKN